MKLITLSLFMMEYQKHMNNDLEVFEIGDLSQKYVAISKHQNGGDKNE